ncbi:MAG: hypothetical protein HQL01_00785 [Nitrospirae bacterium]|nr:hypothetical protein [Nitrospirota bacterium]
MKRIIAIAIAVLLSTVLISCGKKGPPTLKEPGRPERMETPPQKPPDDLSPYNEDTGFWKE